MHLRHKFVAFFRNMALYKGNMDVYNYSITSTEVRQMDFERIRSHVPDYRDFLTVDELNASTMRLQGEFPDVVRVSEVGRSREGRPIYCLKIGNGSRNALMFGCQHPNEPIGAMTLEFLTRELAQDAALREELDYTFYVVKCIDPDALTLNQGWFKGPFEIYHYLRHYYRPAFHEQVAWTFPVDYKRVHFDSPIPETRILMKLIDELQPAFMYSLHNLGFGGAYWYLTRDIPELYPHFYRCVADMGIPRKLGEAEVPYATEFAPAVFKLLTVQDEYEYNSRYISEDYAAAHHAYGTFSGDYANRAGERTFTFVNELPYFFDPRVSDLSLSDRSRRDAVVESCAYKIRHDEDLRPVYERVLPLIDRADNHFATALKERMASGTGSIAAQKRWAEENEAFLAKATVAQVFDNLLVSRFFQATITSLLIRACEMEAGRAQDEAARRTLCEAQAFAEQYLKDECAYLESHMNYQAIPVKKLVTVQAECGLRAAQYISKEKG